MTPANSPTMTFEQARDLFDDDPRLVNLPGLAAAAAARWLIGDSEVTNLIEAQLTDLVHSLHGNGIHHIEDVTVDQLTEWCTNSSERFGPYERRSAIFIARSVLEATSRHRIGPEDLVIELPVLVPGRGRRPLLPIEHASVRAATHQIRRAARNGHDNRLRRAVIALGEAGGTTNEIPQVTYEDIRRGNAKVTFAGTRDTNRREVKLTQWGRTQIFDVLDHLQPGQQIAYGGAERGKGPSSAASVSGVAKRVLREAGLTEKDVTPDSLRNTSALQAWNGRDIQPVLDRLGLNTKNRVQKAWDLVHFFDDNPI